LKSKKKKLKPLPKLEADLWKQVSLYVRKKDADFDGYNRCYTCGVAKHYTELHAGHYVKRSYKALKFDLRNLRPQCPRCNMFLDGNQDAFAEHLELDYGHGILQELGKLKWQEKRFTREEITGLIEHYKKLNEQR
jgi:hypothetical protein